MILVLESSGQIYRYWTVSPRVTYLELCGLMDSGLMGSPE